MGAMPGGDMGATPGGDMGGMMPPGGDMGAMPGGDGVGCPRRRYGRYDASAATWVMPGGDIRV